MLSSVRIDVKAMMATNDASVYDKVDEEVLAAEFLARWERLDDRVSEVAPTDGRLSLEVTAGRPATTRPVS
jgi:hypothetical protein